MIIYYNISYSKLNSVECFRMNAFTLNDLNKLSHPIVFSLIYYKSSKWFWSCCDCHQEIYVPVALKEKQHGSTTWETPVHCQRGGRDRHRREDRGALPSKGVRLEPPFFPSSPCCEYCFRRFWALRMVPGPINTETESRGGGGRGQVQTAKKRRKDEEEEEEEGRTRKWVMKHRHHHRDREQRFVRGGGGGQPSTTATTTGCSGERWSDYVMKNTSEHMCSDTQRPEWCESRMNRLGQFKHKTAIN